MFEFFNEVDQVMGDQPIIRPPCVLDTADINSNVDSESEKADTLADDDQYLESYDENDEDAANLLDSVLILPLSPLSSSKATSTP